MPDRYVCPECGETSDIPGSCANCDIDYQFLGDDLDVSDEIEDEKYTADDLASDDEGDEKPKKEIDEDEI